MIIVSDAIAFIVLVLWPIIPLWWIPVHGANRHIRRLGIAIYPIVFVLWAICAGLIYMNRLFLLRFHIEFPALIVVLGVIFAIAGILLQLWTLKALSARVITGVPEIINGEKARLITKGPFSIIRHPTYVSHTIFLVGIFLSTGVAATGIVAIIDFFVVALVIIPLEERELLSRFGNEYRVYRSRTPRLIPRIGRKKTIDDETNPTNGINSSKLA